MIEILATLLGRRRCPVCRVTSWRRPPAERHAIDCQKLLDEIAERQAVLAIDEDLVDKLAGDDRTAT